MSHLVRLLPSQKPRKRKRKDRLLEDDSEALDEINVERTTIDTEKGPVEVKKYKAIPELKESDTKKDGNYENHPEYEEDRFHQHDGEMSYNYDPDAGVDVAADADVDAADDGLPPGKRKANSISIKIKSY